MPVLPDEERPAAQEPPRRIVAADEDTPEWMVSASRISGAAERRGAPPARQQEERRTPRGAEDDETRAILQMNRKTAETRRSEAAQREAGAPQPRKKTAVRTAKTADAAGTGRNSIRSTGGSAGRKKTAGAPKAAKRAPRKLSKKAAARRRARVRKTLAAVIGTALLLVLVVCGAMGGVRLLDIKRTLDRGDGVFYPNIFVNNIPLEGRTLDETAAIVTQQVEAQIANFSITLRTTDGSGRSWHITGEDLKMQYDVRISSISSGRSATRAPPPAAMSR